MAEIKNLDGWSNEELKADIEQGGRFVMFSYTISIIIMTFKQPTAIYYIRAGEKGYMHGIQYAVLTFFFGWWGIPWGPIYSIMSLYQNLSGGTDVTKEVLDSWSSSQK